MIVKVKSKSHIISLTPMAPSIDHDYIIHFCSASKHNVCRQKCLLSKLISFLLLKSSKYGNYWLGEYDQLTNYLEKLGYFSNPLKKSCSNFFGLHRTSFWSN